MSEDLADLLEPGEMLLWSARKNRLWLAAREVPDLLLVSYIIYRYGLLPLLPEQFWPICASRETATDSCPQVHLWTWPLLIFGLLGCAYAIQETVGYLSGRAHVTYFLTSKRIGIRERGLRNTSTTMEPGPPWIVEPTTWGVRFRPENGAKISFTHFSNRERKRLLVLVTNLREPYFLEGLERYRDRAREAPQEAPGV